MSAAFWLSSDGRGKLKTFSGSTRAGKHILKLEVHYDSALDMAFDLDSLAEVQKARKPTRCPRTGSTERQKRIGKSKPLALPAPEADK